MIQPTILLIDNDSLFMDLLATLLEEKEYRVLKAANIEAAKTHLDNCYPHVIVSDLRAQDDKNDQDQSGLLILRDPELSRFPRVLVSAYLNLDVAQEASGVFEIARKEYPDEILRAIERALAKHPINWNLSFYNEGHLNATLPRLAEILYPELPYNQLNPHIEELETLLKGTFQQSTGLFLGKIIWQNTKKVCLIVSALKNNIEPKAKILIIGEPQKIENVKDALRVERKRGHNTTLGGEMFQTAHWAAISLGTTDGDPAHLMTLGTFFRAASWESLSSVLAHHHDTTLYAWREVTRADQINLSTWFQKRVSHDYLTQITTKLKAIEQLGTLTIKVKISPNNMEFTNATTTHLFPNPMKLLEALPQTVVVGCISPGRINGATLLTDGTDIWLTDFAEYGYAPVTRDYAALEAELRFNYLQTDRFLDIINFENSIPKQLAFALPEDLPATFQKQLLSIQAIREASTQYSRDNKAYQLTLFFDLIEWFLLRDIPEITLTSVRQKILHRLWVLGSITQYLLSQGEEKGEKKETGQPQTEAKADETRIRIKIDEARRLVKLPHKEVSLASKPFKLFLYLFKHGNQDCSRAELCKAYYGKSDPNKEASLNTVIKRLRAEIEPTASRPELIITVEGGYKLIV